MPETINRYIQSVPTESRKVFAQFAVDLFKFIKAEDEIVKGSVTSAIPVLDNEAW